MIIELSTVSYISDTDIFNEAIPKLLNLDIEFNLIYTELKIDWFDDEFFYIEQVITHLGIDNLDDEAKELSKVEISTQDSEVLLQNLYLSNLDTDVITHVKSLLEGDYDD